MTRVLIIEDESPILNLLEDFFHSEGFDTVLARNGQEGVDLAVSEQPDIVLMDILMPGLDGAAATRVLKHDPRTCGIPVVAMSANLMLLAQLDARLIDRIVPKPFDLDELLSVVREECAGAAIQLAG